MQLIELGEKPIQTVIMLNDRKNSKIIWTLMLNSITLGGGWFLRFEKKNL